MNIDPKIAEAIEAAVSAEGQPHALSHKLIRWFEVIATGSEELTDRQSAFGRLELLYKELKTEEDSPW